MTAVEVRTEACPEVVARWRAPRTDVVHEVEVAPGVYEATSGPFTAYRRILQVDERPDGRAALTQRVEFRVAGGPWGLLFLGGFRRAFRRPGGPAPWWAPPEVLDGRGAASLAALASLSLVSGYLGTLITQTLTFAADEFGADDRSQGDTLAAVRIGVLVAMAVSAWADRRGRRRALLATCVLGCLLTAAGAFAPGLVGLGLSQTVARGMATAITLLITVVAAEEMPAGSRAYAAGLLTMTAALGAGMVLWFLPLADLGTSTWRILYVAPLAFLPLIRATARGLPESRRFERRHAEAPWAGHAGRLLLLSSTAFLLAVFTTPASQLQNDFLRQEHGFSASTISLYTMLTVTPGSIGIVVGGRLADQRGRRIVGATGVLLGVTFTVFQFLSAGPWLWVWSTVGSIAAALVVPALSVYGPELFPTSLRARANAIITVVGVCGSVVGLVVVGRLSEHWSLGTSIASMAPAPLLVVLLVLLLYPETAHRELEDLNPEDKLAEAAEAAEAPGAGGALDQRPASTQ